MSGSQAVTTEPIDTVAPDRTRWSRRDEYIVAALACVAFLFAIWYLPAFRAAGGVPFFYQREFGPAVMLACGRGFVNPDAPAIPPLQAFLDERVDRFRCEDLPQSVHVGSLNTFHSYSRYLLTVVAATWRATGIRWRAIDLVTAGLFSFSLSAAYAALRFVFGQTLAVIVTLLWATSPWHVQNLPHLRDYSKVPFFVLALLAIALLRIERRAAALIALGAAFGAVQGFGYGMRADAAINVIPFLIVLFAGASAAPGRYTTRVMCAVAAITAFAIVAAPVLKTYRGAGSLWHVSLLGLTTPFDVNLNLATPAPPYDFGYMYNDEYIETVVRSHWSRLHPNESVFRMWSPTYGVACPALYASLAGTFPGDILTRLVAAAIDVVNLPFLQGHGDVPVGISNRAVAALFEARAALTALLEGCGPLLMTTVFVLVGMDRLRYARLAFVGFGVWAAYPALQYQFRHVFHFELVVIAAIAFGGVLLWERIRRGSNARAPRPAEAAGTALLRSIATVAGLFLAIALMLFAARAIQSPRVHALLAAYDNSRLSPLATRADPLPDGRTRLTTSAFDPPPPVGGVDTAMVVAEFATERCGRASSMVAAFRYEELPRGPSMYDFTRQTTVPLAHRAGSGTRVFLPVYAIYQDATLIARFSGVEVARAMAPCVTLYRIQDLGPLPLLLPATLTPNWTDRPLYQRINLETTVPPIVSRVFVRWWPSVLKRLPVRIAST